MEEKKKKYLFFTTPHLKHLLFLFFFIAACFKKGIQIFFENNQRIEIEFLKLYIYDFGDFLSIIPFIIIKKRIRPEKIINGAENKKGGSNIEYIYNEKEDNKDIGIAYRNFFIYTIADFIAQILSVIFYIILS